MAKCPFAIWKPISGPSGPHLGGAFKIVHHTTEGGSAEGAFAAYKAKRADPHFTVDEKGIYQHIDTGLGARALRNPAGGVETNRDSAVQIELVGFAHQPKHSQSLINLARLCRWIESVHQVPQTWPAGKPKAAVRGKDPGGHNRDPEIWDSKGGHYGHCHVPENDHWDPGYSDEEAEFVLHATFDPKGNLVGSPPRLRAGAPGRTSPSTMPGHHDVEVANEDDKHAVINIAVSEDDEGVTTGGTGKKGETKKSLLNRRRIKRILNARPDTLDFRDRMYVPTLIEVPSRIPLADYTRHGLPILDQGTEGACTGFGLASVANYLLTRRAVVPDRSPVSARMFYELARRYDEWPGEDYSGSSARGAMKGWQKHGVCSEEDWPYQDERGGGRFTSKRMSAARCRPLGAYYRVNHKDLISMHSAIAEVGILYATSAVHQGWNEVRSDGMIQLQPGTIGGHAFAIVAYDEHGFWIQNSWGESWGASGFAKISYDDWLLNGTDVWVARLGAPVVLSEPAAYAQAHASTSGQSATYTYSDLRPHLISVGNDGRLKPGGDYGITHDELEHIFNHDVRGFLTKTQGPRQLLLYAHGGLTNEKDAVQRIAEYRSAVMNAGIYPLAFIWRTDYWTTMTNILEDALRRRRSEGLLSGTLDFVLDRADDMLEPIARTASGKAAWDEMKENALRSSQPGGAADLVVQHMRTLMTDFPDLQIHLVGHSAGSIFLAPVAQLLAAEGEIKDGPVKGRTGGGQTIASCTLWAPAISTDLFKATYAPLIDSSGAGRIANMAVYCLTDTAEQADHCARIYNKSLLYLVSHAFEEKWRIPFSRTHTGQPILGLVKSIEKDDELKTLFRQNAQLVLAPNKAAENSLDESDADSHGGFDDDMATVRSTLRRMLAAANVTPADPVQSPTFGISASRLRQRRKEMDKPSSR